MIEINNITIVPPNISSQDPRPFAYLYPQSIRDNDRNFIAFIKKMQRFNFYNTLKDIEDYGKQNGYLLVPTVLLHWRRRKDLNNDRRIVVGRNSFYYLLPHELTPGEQKKLLDYARDMEGVKL